jgi:hypothetical protein
MNAMHLDTVRLRTFPRWTTHWHYCEDLPDASEFELQLSGSSHPVQTICPLYTHIRCPCLEQHIILQLSSTANFTVQMPPRYWQLSQAHPIPRLHATLLRDIGNYPRRTPIPLLHTTLLRIIGNYPRRTPTPRLHATLNVTPIRDLIIIWTLTFSTVVLPTTTPSFAPKETTP